MKNNKFSQSKIIDTLGILMVFLLTLEYMLGMYTNMFIEIPKEVNGWQFAVNSGMILSHIILGSLLAIVSFAILIVSIKSKNNSWIILSIIGLLAILAALSSGSAFINGQAESNSFIMSIGMGVSILAYSAGIYFSSMSKRDA